jgi:hypothetical protein
MAVEFASLRQMLKNLLRYLQPRSSKCHLTSVFARTRSVYGEFGLNCAEHERFERGHGRRNLSFKLYGNYRRLSKSTTGSRQVFWACRWVFQHFVCVKCPCAIVLALFDSYQLDENLSRLCTKLLSVFFCPSVPRSFSVSFSTIFISAFLQASLSEKIYMKAFWWCTANLQLEKTSWNCHQPVSPSAKF